MPRPATPPPARFARLVDSLSASRAALFASKYALPIERAGMVAALALGGSHG